VIEKWQYFAKWGLVIKFHRCNCRQHLRKRVR